MTFGEAVSVIAAFVAIVSVIVTLNRNGKDSANRKLDWEIKEEGRITALENEKNNLKSSLNEIKEKLDGYVKLNDRTVALETKMGVFWHMVEQMSVAQLVHTTPEVVEAAKTYDKLKNRTPTPVLKVLDEYFTERLYTNDESLDNEKALILLKLGAIKAQLVDRGEEPIL